MQFLRVNHEEIGIMNRTVRVGIIGCGGIANGKHMPSLKAVQGVQMVAFCDLIPEKAEKAAREYGTPDAKTYTNYKELYEIALKEKQAAEEKYARLVKDIKSLIDSI